MNAEKPLIVSPGRVWGPAVPGLALEIARGLRDQVEPDQVLNCVAYILCAAVGDLSRRRAWPALRQELNEALGGAIAAGLDAGLGLAGHACLVDARSPMSGSVQ